jgi:hypothetical protein
MGLILFPSGELAWRWSVLAVVRCGAVRADLNSFLLRSGSDYPSVGQRYTGRQVRPRLPRLLMQGTLSEPELAFVEPRTPPCINSYS